MKKYSPEQIKAFLDIFTVVECGGRARITGSSKTVGTSVNLGCTYELFSPFSHYNRENSFKFLSQFSHSSCTSFINGTFVNLSFGYVHSNLGPLLLEYAIGFILQFGSVTVLNLKISLKSESLSIFSSVSIFAFNNYHLSCDLEFQT